MKLQLLAPAALLGLIGLAACGDPARAGHNGPDYVYYEKRDYGWEQRESFRTDMERAVDKLEARARELRAKAANGGTKLKAETQRLIDDIEARLPELRRNLAEVGDATREGWQDFKRKFHDTFDDLGRRLNDAFH